MADDIRALSETLARDPASLVYAELAEALRHRGDLGQALVVATRGLARHPEHADGLDGLGRIHADRGDLAAAREAWTRALEVAPDHAGALKGMGFALFRGGDSDAAEAALERALAANPSDEGTRRALETVRRVLRDAARSPGEPAAPHVAAGGPAAEETPATPPPAPFGATPAEAAGASSDPAGRPPVFRGLEGATADILLCDDRGLVVAGGLAGPGGVDVSELAAAALAGVSGEAGRTAQYLSLGGWRTIVAETDSANFVLTPAGPGALLLVRRDRSVPVGLVVRVAERALGAARDWLERQGA